MKQIVHLMLALWMATSATGGTPVPPTESHTSGKLFVDVSAADYIEIIDLASREAVAKITVGRHPHGLVVGRGRMAGRARVFLYVTVESTGELVIADAGRREIVARVEVGKVPNQLTLTADGAFAYVPLREEAQVAVVELGADGRTPKVIKRIPIGEWPHNAYTGQTTGRIYVTSFKGRKIHVFDPSKHELLFEVDFPGEVRPVALTRDETRAYVAQSDFHGFVVANIPNRKVIQRVELPTLPPGTPEPFLKTYVHGLTLSPDEKELWVTSCAGAAVYVYSVPELKLLAKVPTGKFPHWFAWEKRPDGSWPAGAGWLLWVSQMESNQVSAIDPVKRQVVATIPTGPAPRRIAISGP